MVISFTYNNKTFNYSFTKEFIQEKMRNNILTSKNLQMAAIEHVSNIASKRFNTSRNDRSFKFTVKQLVKQ
jgi:hypothetical protein